MCWNWRWYCLARGELVDVGDEGGRVEVGGLWRRGRCVCGGADEAGGYVLGALVSAAEE
jgi:hypothetical protein